MPRLALVALLLLPLLIPESASAEELALANRGFALWKGDLPVGWTRSEGAKNGNSASTTSITRLADGGVSLAGNAGTHHWSMLGQRVDVRAGDVIELAFTARATGLKLDRGQFGSSYVGFVLRDTDGKPNGFAIEDVRSATWRGERIFLRVPESAASVEVALFLSMSGRLEVRSVEARRLGPEASFDVLAASMDRHYSFFAPHGIDWKALCAKHAAEARKAKTPEAFIDAVRPLLASLKDGHVWIDPPDGTRIPTWKPTVDYNFDLKQLLPQLSNLNQVIRNVLTARTTDGFGYFALGTMDGTSAEYDTVETAFRGLFDAPGLVIDLRMNGGGQEVWGQRLLRFLTKTRVLYGRALRRGGPAHDDLVPAGDRYLLPSKAGHYTGPAVVLIGPGCVSSGEGMAMMLKALPKATLVGLPTRGSSGNPQPLHLPNGVTIWYSRWISKLPDGTPLERKGVAPDVRIEAIKGANPSMDEALKILKAKTAGR